MKNSIVFIGIALLSLTSLCNAANLVDKISNSCQAEILDVCNSSNGTQTFKFNFVNRDTIDIEVVERVNKSKIEKTPEQLIAEDNAITENNISNELQALDFKVINNNSIAIEVVEIVHTKKIEKTPEELIAEDNAITENNISNETQALDFEIINRNSNFAKSKNKSFLAIN